MGKATLQILEKRVGEGGDNDDVSVRRLQSLLYHSDYLKAVNLDQAANGRWDKKSREALADYLHLRTSSKDVYLDPNDPRMDELLVMSPCTIPMYPGQQGSRPFLALQSFFKMPPVTPFRYPKGMLVWGVAGVPKWAVVTEDMKHRRWLLPIPSVLNCATYVNLMMSVWRRGNCHGQPYQPGVRGSGATSFARVRYGYRQLNDGKPIRTATSILLEIEKTGWDGLYCLQTSEGGVTSSVGHMALLYKSRVYECNYGGDGVQRGYDGTVQEHSFTDWMKFRAVLGCFVSGPSVP